MIIIVSILLFLFALAYFCLTEYRKWLKHRGTDHREQWVLHVAFLLPPVVGFTVAHNGHHLPVFALAASMVGFCFWTLFDGIYNEMRGYDWWFTGGHNDPTEINDSKLDLFLFKIGETATKILKIGGCIVTITVYVLSYIHNL